MTPRGDGLAGTLASNGGACASPATSLVATAQASVNATLTPVRSAAARDRAALAALGAPDANGAVRVAWRGTLR